MTPGYSLSEQDVRTISIEFVLQLEASSDPIAIVQAADIFAKFILTGDISDDNSPPNF